MNTRDDTSVINLKRKNSDVAISSQDNDSWGSLTDNYTKKLCQSRSGFFSELSHHSQESAASEILINEPLKEELSFIEFMSALLTHNKSQPAYQQTSEFLDAYFSDNKFVWPTNNIAITFTLNFENNFEVYAFNKDGKHLLLCFSVSLSDESESTVELLKLTIHPDWVHNDVKELINLVGCIFKSKVDVAMVDIADDAGIARLNVHLDTPLNWFKHEKSFSKYCNKIQGKYSFMSQFMLNHTIIEDDKNVFWIGWPQVKHPNDNMYLKLEFSTFIFKNNPVEGDYHTWLFSENHFLDLHSYQYKPETQQYFRFKAYEERYSGESYSSSLLSSSQVLDVWFSLDSSFGELRDLKKGEVLTGTEVMSAFDLLNNNLLKIQTIYLSDASRSNGDVCEKAKNQIVFRILKSVAYGQTWYEKCGYQAFKFDNFEARWPDGVCHLSQNPEKYSKARKELMKLSIFDLYEQLETCHKKLGKSKHVEGQPHILKDLIKEYYDCEPTETRCKKITLSELVSTIDAKYKKTKDDNDLIQVFKILVVPGNSKCFSEDVNKPNYYNYLDVIDGTKFFRKSINQPQMVDNVSKQKLSMK